MKALNKYASPAAMRTALEERLNRTARERNQDILRLRRQVAFDRLLARIFAGPQSAHIVLKGGYALELRLREARTTKDIDLCIDDRTMQSSTLQESLLSIIREAVSTDLNDYFEFTVGNSILDLENPPESWRIRYKKMAESCGMDGDLKQAFVLVGGFYRKLIIADN